MAKPTRSAASDTLASRMAATVGKGKGGTVRTVRAALAQPRSVLPTGHATLDAAIGIGGLPAGTAVTFAGPPSCGKTTLAIGTLRQIQRLGGVGIILDGENKFDVFYAQDIGLNVDDLVIARPDDLEESFKMIDDFLGLSIDEGTKVPICFVYDSVSSFKTRRVMEGEYDDVNWAGEARYFSDKLPKLLRKIERAQAYFIAIAQVRTAQAGNVSVKKVGPGNVWLHQTNLVLEFSTPRKDGALSSSPPGEIVSVSVMKNQVSRPYRNAKLYNRYGYGHDPIYSLLYAAIDKKIIKKSGSVIEFNGVKLGNGIEAATQILAKNDKLRMAIVAELYKGYRIPAIGGIDKDVLVSPYYSTAKPPRAAKPAADEDEEEEDDLEEEEEEEEEEEDGEEEGEDDDE